jgi:CRISPR-associated protein Csy3
MSKVPSVLSFQRCLNVTDGTMSSIIHAGEQSEQFAEINVIRHGIRGIQGQRGAPGVSFIQITESAKTSTDANGLSVKFAITPLDLRNALFGCNEPDYRASVNAFIDSIVGSESLAELSRRYARNVLNGRWLWRNRVLSDNLAVSVTWSNGQAISSGFGRMNDFDAYTLDEIKMGAAVQSVFSGESKVAFSVEGRVLFDFTGAVEVYPSQNFTSGKPKGFARPLYKIEPVNVAVLRDLMNAEPANFADTLTMGKAGLRDQKIGNAIRTVDTWYEGGRIDAKPIAIEPNGANLDEGKFFRSINGVFNLLDNISDMTAKAANNTNIADPELMFLIAVIVRGGVYGEKGEEKEKKTREKTAKGVKASSETLTEAS